MAWDPERPYNDLPPVPDLERLETRRVLKAAISARAELARLDQATDLIADPRVLLGAIPLLEAQASSEIENIVTTADALFQQDQLSDVDADPAVKEALRYRSALWSGHRSMGAWALTTGTAVEVCSEVKGRPMHIRALPGTRIGRGRRIVYAPPEGADVIRDKLSGWERFIHAANDLDPVIRMAAAHYQFEAIHPFSDGNGRTGRILNILTLVATGVLREPILYLSRPIIDTKSDYYRLLLAVTAEGAWEEWLLYMVDAVRSAASTTSATIAAISRTRDQFVADHWGATPGLENAAFRQLLFAQPYLRIGRVVEACGVSRQTASAWLHALTDDGALDEVRRGRDVLFLNTSFLGVLTHPGT